MLLIMKWLEEIFVGARLRVCDINENFILTTAFFRFFHTSSRILWGRRGEQVERPGRQAWLAILALAHAGGQLPGFGEAARLARTDWPKPGSRPRRFCSCKFMNSLGAARRAAGKATWPAGLVPRVGVADGAWRSPVVSRDRLVMVS